MVTSEENYNLPCLKDGKWEPVRTGNYRNDCQTGHALAENLLSFIAESGNPAVFGTVVRAIVESTRYEAVEIGFCSRIGIHLCTPPGIM